MATQRVFHAIVTAAVSCVVVAAGATSALAAPSFHDHGKGKHHHNGHHGGHHGGGHGKACAGVVGSSDARPPQGSQLIVNALMKVVNHEDTGTVGYWALDHYNQHIRVWQTPTGGFYAGVFDEGHYQTFAGALSPASGVTEPSDGTGPFHGGYIETFTGTLLASPTEPTHGDIGTFDFGGSKSDILLGSFGSGQTGDTSAVDWTSFYFSSVSGASVTPWGWDYRYPKEVWCHTSAGSSGDIVTR